MAHQFRQAPLPGREFRLVVLLRQTLRHVQRTQHVEAVEPRRERRRYRGRLCLLFSQALLKRFEDRPADGQRPIAVVCPLDNDPGRPRRTCRAQQMPGHYKHLVIGLQPIPTRLGHPPASQRIRFNRRQALALRILREVYPELEHQSTLVDQHLLEAVKFIHALIKIGSRKVASNPVGDRPRIPRTGGNPDSPFLRQRSPETPHRRTLSLFLRWRGKGASRHVARVHPLVEGVDGVTLPRPIDTANQDDDRKGAIFAQFLLRFEQRRAQLGYLNLERFLVDLVSQHCRFEHH